VAPIAFLLILVVVIRVIYRKARRRAGGGFGIGPGASGAMYGFLNEDKREAIEIIVEQRTADRDPERATDKDPDGDGEPASRNRP
jgi:hypothetical protein